jgi:hypothetical protein
MPMIPPIKTEGKPLGIGALAAKIPTVFGLSSPCSPLAEIAFRYSITSSARATSVGGKSTPSAFRLRPLPRGRLIELSARRLIA